MAVAAEYIECDYACARRAWGPRIANELWSGIGRNMDRREAARISARVTHEEYKALCLRPGPAFAGLMIESIARRALAIEEEIE